MIFKDLMNRVLIIFSIMILVFVLGCSKEKSSGAASAAADSTGNEKRELTVGINYDFADLDPFGAGTQGKNYLYYIIYEYLCNTDSSGKLYGVIAKDWKCIDDGYTYDITIYDYVYDTAGHHITAEDVVFSYNAYKSNGKGMARYIAAIEKTGDYSVRLTINDKSIGSFEQLIRATAIVSEEAYVNSSDHFSTSPVGTTQYKLTKFVSGASAAFEKVDKYWQTDESLRSPYSKANVDKINYQVIKESAQMAIALETGAIDIADGLSITEVSHLEGNPEYQLFSHVNNFSYQILFSGKDSPFANNQDLREAVAYAIDKQELVTALLGGRGDIEYTTGVAILGDFVEKWKSEDYYNFDLDKSKACMAKAGYPNGGVTIDIMVNNQGFLPRMAQIIQGYLQKIGIQSNILAYDSALFSSNTNLPETYDLMINPRGGFLLINSWLNIFDNTNAQYKGFTSNGFVDDKLQSLLMTAAAQETHDDVHMDAFHQYLKSKTYTVGLFEEYFYDCVKASAGIKSIVWDTRAGYIFVPGTIFN
jgi:ABC-type transport system substrate-binding protein